MKINYMKIRKFWPLICGLIVGGMLGGIMQSLAAFLLFGGVAWAYFGSEFFNGFSVESAMASGRYRHDNSGFASDLFFAEASRTPFDIDDKYFNNDWYLDPADPQSHYHEDN